MTAIIYYTLAVEKVKHAVSSLPEHMRPGPDCHGLPWEVVLLMAFLGGIFTLMFFCRAFRSVKSRFYVGKEKKLGQRVTDAFEEKCKALDDLSECKQRYEQLEADLRNGELAEQAERADLLEMSKNLDQSNREILAELDRIEKDWESEKASRIQQDELLAGMQSSLKNMEEEAREQRSQMEQTQTIFKIYEMNSERLKTNLQAAQEENCDLRESEGQLLREAEGRAERLDDLSEQIRMCESSQRNMQEHCSNKDEHIQEMSKNLDQSNREILAELDRIEKDWESEKASRIQQDELLAGMQSSLKNMEEEAREQRSQMEQTLTECLLKMTDWDSKLQKEADRKDNNGKGTPENGGCLDTHQNPKVQKLLDSAKMSADLRSVVEERNWVFARLADEAKAKQDLQERIEMLQSGEVLLESENDKVLRATQKLQQKVQIMAEIHLENELRLHSSPPMKSRLTITGRMEILNPGRKRKTGCLPDFLVRREQRKISKNPSLEACG